MDTITGKIDFIKFNRNGFLIASLKTGEAIIGDMADPILDQEYIFSGQWTESPRWGRQFKFSSYRAELPQSTDGIKRYIVRAKWVGPIIARRIVDIFGEQSLEILKSDPEQVAAVIKGLTLERAQAISKALKENEDLEAATVELESILGGHKIPKSTIGKLIQKYGPDAPTQIRQNPYLLTEVRGIGFITADRIALATGYDREGLPRRMAAILHVLREAANTQGHIWLPLEQFEVSMTRLIGIPSDGAALELVKKQEVILKNEMLALADLARDEAYVAGKIRLLLEKAEALEMEILREELYPDQQEALNQALAHGVFILTGAPGTGKTHLLKQIVESFTNQNFRIALAAPTGKAAKRMSEMIGQEASTIHRLLDPEPYYVDGEVRFCFSFNESNPLPADLVVIDEFSMVDISLAASLFRAIEPGTRVLIVGDHYQLPSVGPGSVLRDLLATGMPSYELTEIKRNTGDIVQTCHAIKDARRVTPSPQLVPEEGLNFRHIEESDPYEIQKIIREIVTERMPQRGYDPVWDVQVISPMNEKTLLSCLHLNTILQEVLNPGPLPKGLPFREGDKVIQRKNETIDFDFVVNGDQGTIQAIDDDKIIVDFRYPDRRVRVSRKEHHLTLAYCLTVHKFQGSECSVIIIPLHSSFGAFFNRELVYTAISRARDICITVGQWGALEQAVRRVGNDRRVTRLAELMRLEGERNEDCQIDDSEFPGDRIPEYGAGNRQYHRGSQ